MKTLRKTIFWLLVFHFASVLVLAQGTYTQIDVPGAVQTEVFGINTASDIVGNYEVNNATYHGFLLSNGVYTTIDYPGASSSEATGINDVGQIVGAYFGATFGGFLYDVQSQTFTNIDFPGSIQTYATAINNAGTIVGFVSNNQAQTVGFELVGGQFRKVLPHGFNYSNANGINNLGQVVGLGTITGHAKRINFLFTDGKFQQLKIPAPFALAEGINDAGAIVGGYGTFSEGTTGFLYQSGTLESLMFPGSANTGATGINNAGEVVGYFIDGAGNTHGITWTPPGDAPKK